ncbi:hypothetical protein TNCT_43451 [Trichonephila clavata]|uniref:Uncharacterized protein n=1 Tax=Trichonephila clavata TaxID=2740835 RepID=A0A8X6GV34_TRICU|nr:hypothetical protein TNCT_43451 [Trichonephila clavata]
MAAQMQLSSLQITQNIALSMILNAPRYIPGGISTQTSTQVHYMPESGSWPRQFSRTSPGTITPTIAHAAIVTPGLQIRSGTS